MKEVIKINENELTKFIKEAIEEVNYSTVKDAVDKIEMGGGRSFRYGVDFSDVKEAISKIQDAIETYKESFHKLSGQQYLNYYYDNHRWASDGQVMNCERCLDYIRAFFDRKEKQYNNFYDSKQGMERDYDRQVMDVAQQNGIDTSTMRHGYEAYFALLDKFDDDEDAVLELFPKDVQDYIESEY